MTSTDPENPDDRTPGAVPPPEYGVPQGGYPPPPTSGYGAPQGAYPPPPAPGYGAPQDAYPPAPAPGYGPPPGAYPPPYGVAPPLSDSDQRLWAVLSHVGTLVLGFLAPLIVWLVFKDRGAFVDDQSKESLNFQISATIYALALGVISLVTLGIGAVLYIPFGIVLLVFVIIAAVKASSGERYRYPLTIRLIK